MRVTRLLPPAVPRHARHLATPRVARELDFPRHLDVAARHAPMRGVPHVAINLAWAARVVVAMRATLVAALLVGCASTPKHPIAVAVVIGGDSAKVGTLAPHAVSGLELSPFAIPSAPAKPADDSSTIVTKARASYVNGDFEACRTDLARIDLGSLLAHGQRTLAARTIAFDAACAFGAQAKAESEVLATKLASLGLEMPDAPLAHDAEKLIGNAIAAVGKLPRHALAVSGEVGGRLSIDGRAANCTLPCTIDVPAGDHFITVETDGFMPNSRWVRVPDEKTLALPQIAATAEAANEQWHARIGRGLPPDDAVGARLLARISKQPRIVHLYGGTRVTGTLIVDGEIRATGEGTAPSLVRELAYDGRLLERPAIWQKPSFWIATSVAVAIVATAIIYAVYEPDVESKLRFP